MAKGSDKVLNGFILGAVVGILAYYGSAQLPFIGASIGTALKGVLDSIGKSLLGAVWKTATENVLSYAGAITSIIIGGIIGIIVDTR